MRKSAIVSAIIASVLAGAAFGDIIDLKDGRSFSGTLSKTGEDATIKTDDGQTISVKNADVVRVTSVTLTPADREAVTEWSRVLTKMRDATDIQVIVDLTQGFVDKYGDSASGPAARTSLAHYKQLADVGAVKYRGKWMTKADKDAMTKAWRDAVQAAIDSYSDGKWKDALTGAKAVADKDKENIYALAIAGLASFRLVNPGPAKTFFTTLAAADSSTPLAENDLAVVCMSQKQYAEGIAHFYKALQIAPGNRTVLDNAAEAINTYRTNKGDKKATTYVALQKLFDSAESRMEAVMLQQGMVRSGGTWITKQESDKNKKSLTDLQKKMSALENKYQQAKNELTRLESQIKQAQDLYNNSVQQVANYDSMLSQRGQRTAADIANLQRSRDQEAQTAQNAQRQGQQYMTQRDQLLASSKDLFTQADAMKAQQAALTASFTGTYRLLELDDADSPATQPATAPAATKPGA